MTPGTPPRRVVVTGGAGFIGSSIVDRLIADGHKVAIIDDLSTGKREHLNLAASFHELDITTGPEPLRSVFDGASVVFHTAALARIARSIADPLRTHAVNVTGTLNVLKAAAEAGVGRVVFSSSSSVYGDQATLPLTEDMSPNPLNPYATQKLVGELYCRSFTRTFALPTVCLRYFNVYGPRQAMEGAYKLVIGVFLEQRDRGEPLTIDGDGNQTRDFTYISDVVSANVLAGFSQSVGQAESVNVGTGTETSVNRIADLIGGPRVHRAPRGFDERFKRADRSRAARLLGWSPRVTVEEGIHLLLPGS